MDPFAYHLTLRIVDDRLVAKTVAERRRLARSFLERDPIFQLLTFRGVDTHLHALVAALARSAAEFARRVEISIQLALGPGAPFATVHLTPIKDQRHLRSAFDYILDQERHHGLSVDPLHEAGNLQDLLGLRLVGRFTASHVRTWLPRVRRDDLVRFLPDGALTPRELGLGDLPGLADAAAAALALPDLRRKTRDAVMARAAAAIIGREVAPPSMVADVLALSRSGERRLQGLEPSPELLAAVRGQLLLRGR